ncbi:P-loop ATPase, Sll1717 family [Aurantimonas endophytica]|uniref:Uncharacterized protein n=1 Tax=Aurantimonas endophytica TaxID=1522175 RepID=A0A7W6HDY7_9HYPH|nr:hypothetical protein [Aurantimonas endophytica]MBB4003193.1 hypothetical protein [Aurantimonas endophytica]MCO6404058.1 hypothetical protein [Aurantimonas endophytica]
MASFHKTAFFAYPGQPHDLVGPIAAAAQSVNGAGRLNISIWPQLEIFGAEIPEEVRKGILTTDVTIVDVTVPNANVYYEAGFAIGSGKSLAPVVNASFANAQHNVQRQGIFDNIGYQSYENSQELSSKLEILPKNNLVDLYSKPINHQQPLFFLNSLRKTDFIMEIVSSVKESRAFFRSYDPAEVARFSTVWAIGETTASSGIIIPILASHIEDADQHNLRAAFLAGLGHGLGRQTLIIQHGARQEARPADFREFIKTVSSEQNTSEVVKEFAQQASIAAQSFGGRKSSVKKSSLQRIKLGSSAAENEFRTLEEYFVETSEFIRTLRGEINVVAGRKGSGKTAIFFMVRDRVRPGRDAVVTDLKPESHQLSLFREQLVKIVDVGAFDHTLAAFWYFIILSEVLHSIKRNLDYRSKFDTEAMQASIEIARTLEEFKIEDSGDFTSRINRLGTFVINEIADAKRRSQSLTPDRLTNIVFRGGIPQLKGLISKYTKTHSELYLLFDNIDKGWPADGVSEFDVRLVRILVETLDKIKRDFATVDRNFQSVVFLRNDIFELLLSNTPDKGKAGSVRIDWTDRAKLKQVIYLRLKSSSGEVSATFEALWRKSFVATVGGQDSFEYFVDHCLMRPRFLINIIDFAISNAINRGHNTVTEEDCVDAVKQHSNYLVDDFGYEVRDVSGITSELFYALIGSSRHTGRDDIIGKLRDFGINEADVGRAFNLLLWYGVVGLVDRHDHERYIYDYDYNQRRLDAEVRLAGPDANYVINPALFVAFE